MNRLDELINNLVENTIKFNEELNFVVEHEENLTEENKKQLIELIEKYEKEVLPELEILNKHNQNLKKIK